MVINHNLSALNTLNTLGKNTKATSNSLAKLSSGYRINGAADDAAGLAISEKMRGQISGLKQASANSQDAISLLQTAEGGLDQTHSILQRMRQLAVQSASDTNTADDRQKIQGEVDQLAKEISRISNTTEFNTQNLLAGGQSGTYQIGANAGQTLSTSITAMDSATLGVAGSVVSAASVVSATTTKISITDISRGLSAATGYQIHVTAVSAAIIDQVTSTGAKYALGTTALSVTNASNFQGVADTNFQVKIAAVSNTTGGSSIATALTISRDNGISWTRVDGDFRTGVTIDGMQFQIGGVDYAASATQYNVGDSFAFSVRASAKTIQFKNTNFSTATIANISGASNLGAGVTVHVGDTAATIGDAGNNRTVSLSFDYAKLTAGTATFVAKTTNSTSAVIRNGAVSANANVVAGISVASQSDASKAITAIDKAINAVSKQRSQLGAYQNRLTNTIDNLNTSNENITSAESRIRDVDMSSEMMNYQKNNILQQAATAMLAKANQQPQSVLQLLQG
jgi:flagellin